MDNRLLDQLKIKFPGREHQIDLLYNLFGHNNEPFASSIYIYGATSTGKSTIISSLLNGLKIKNVQINLIECYSSKVLFESILNQLSDYKIDIYRGHPYAKCDNIMDFIFNLRKLSKEVNLSKSLIILDKAEYLRNMDHNLLPAFLRFQELSSLDISVVFISEIMFENYYNKATVFETITVHFPQYNRDQLFVILRLERENFQDLIVNNFNENFLVSESFFDNYLNLFLSVFYRACRDLSELRHMAKQNFIRYCEPIFKKDCKAEDASSLWRHISPIFKASLEVLYLRFSPFKEEQSKQTSINENLAQSLELPYYAKYLLIAAYLASYNPPKSDKRLFMKNHGKKTKRVADVKVKQVVSEKLNTQLGPKTFGFERLIAIFYAIIDEKVDFNSNLLVQISTLVELQLLSAVSDKHDLDGRKYKCCIGLEFIQVVSKSLGFEVSKYLVDFN